MSLVCFVLFCFVVLHELFERSNFDFMGFSGLECHNPLISITSFQEDQKKKSMADISYKSMFKNWSR